MIFRMVFLLLVVLQSVPANATPLIFTDRAAFDAAVGNYTLLTLDAPDPISQSELIAQISAGFIAATYSDLFRVQYDAVAYQPHSPGGVRPDLVRFGAGFPFETVATVLEPVTAFGFDIGQAYTTNIAITLNGTGYQLDGLSFFGLLWDAPTTVRMVNYIVRNPITVFDLDNVAIKTVPEPASLLLLAVGLMGMVALHGRRIRSASH